MGAFNILEAEIACPTCGARAVSQIQFSFGHTWQHHYRIGDHVRRGGNDVGPRGRARVLVEGIGERCAVCGAPDALCEIMIEDDVLTGVVAPAEPRVFPPEGFRVMDEGRHGA